LRRRLYSNSKAPPPFYHAMGNGSFFFILLCLKLGI
jgi:hypothetical protein